jgi:hypothetical protein
MLLQRGFCVTPVLLLSGTDWLSWVSGVSPGVAALEIGFFAE